MSFHRQRVRVLIVPGLHGSGPAHWQTWLQGHFRQALRVEQPDAGTPDLAAWSQRITDTLAAEPAGDWVAVAHSFGCLALVQHLIATRPRRDADDTGRVAAALLVAPADPSRFRLADTPFDAPLGIPGRLFASDTDRWMGADEAAHWARRWNVDIVNLGDAGHINAEAGFGPLPPAKQAVQSLIHRVEQTHRLSRAHVRELSFAI